MDAMPAFHIPPAVQRGWALMKRHLRVFVVLGIVSAIVQAAINALERAPFLRLVFELLNVAVGMIWVRFALEADADRAPDARLIGPTLSRYLEYLLAFIVYAVSVGVGLVFLIVPGVIVAVRLGLFPFFLLDRNADAMGALKQSWEATRGTAWHLFLFALVLLGINLLGAIALGIGLLVSVPVTSIAAAHVYRQLRERAAVPPGAAAPSSKIATPT